MKTTFWNEYTITLIVVLSVLIIFSLSVLMIGSRKDKAFTSRKQINIVATIFCTLVFALTVNIGAVVVNSYNTTQNWAEKDYNLSLTFFENLKFQNNFRSELSNGTVVRPVTKDGVKELWVVKKEVSGTKKDPKTKYVEIKKYTP